MQGIIVALPLSIYVHWPFCKSKCPYCDFNSHVRDSVEHARWRAALLQELAFYAALAPDRRVTSIFFGGGTPSLMEPATVEAVINAVLRHWPSEPDLEITLEANPTSVEAGRFRDLRAAGVERVSLGVQALNAADLAFLGRGHSAEEALAAVTLAAELFPRISFDLIYARPGQTLAAWEAELARALTCAKGHLSLYQLTVEENTAFHHAHAQGKWKLPEEDIAARMYERTQEIMDEAGLPAYEISNHARPGEESRHNLNYWRGGDYLGIGPGAHGRYRTSARRLATENIKSPERWLERTEKTGRGVAAETELSLREQQEEAVMMGLRLASGIHYGDWRDRTGLALEPLLNRPAIDWLRQQGLVEANEAAIRATRNGQLLLNSVTGALLAD